MARWTIEQLKNINDIDFAIAILNERRSGLNPYSPLSEKLKKTIGVLTVIKNNKDITGLEI